MGSSWPCTCPEGLASVAGVGVQSPSVPAPRPPQALCAAHASSGLQVADVGAGLGPGGPAEKETRLQPCTECGRTFPSGALLLQHSREAHGRERIHVCPLCRKAFKRATHLKVRAGVTQPTAPGTLPLAPGARQGTLQPHREVGSGWGVRCSGV